MSARTGSEREAPRAQAALGFFLPAAEIVETVTDVLRRMGVASGDTLMAAVSGGADSVALLVLLQETAPRLGARVIAAHLDHIVRGPQSAEDAIAVGAMCRRRGVPLTVGRLTETDVKAAAKRAGSLEGGLRDLRCRFLERTASRLGAHWIATGHQRNDQAETVLFRCLRGMDWRSFAGIPGTRGRYLRPLLGFTREDLLRVCSAAGETPVEDPTNRDAAHARNRIRHVTLPSLGRTFHRDAALLLCRIAAAAASLRRFERETLAASGIPFEMVRLEGIDVGVLRPLPAVLLRGALLDAVSASGVARVPGTKVLEEMERMVRLGRRGDVSLAGGTARFEGGRLKVLQGLRSRVPAGNLGREQKGPFRVVLRVSETTFDGERIPKGKDRVLLRKSAILLPLEVRTRRAGDRFEPLGVGVGKSLKEFFIDRKVPRTDRPAVPLVVDRSGRILWVVGVEIAHWARLVPSQPCEALLIEARVDFAEKHVVRDGKIC